MASKNKLEVGELMQSGYGTESNWVFWAISMTFPAYFLGALYLIAPILGWLVALALVQRCFFEPHRLQAPQSMWANSLLLLWVFGSLGLLVALIVGHAHFDLGLGKTIKSIIGWAKGWALIGVFILIGVFSHIPIRAIVRAACIVGTCALALSPLLIVAYLLGLPGDLYVSPLKAFGGSGPEFFTVILYEIDPGNGNPRWRFFAPWAPAVGFVANLYFICCLYEHDNRWKWLGLTGNALMIVLSASRMGLIVLTLIPCIVFFTGRLSRVSTWLLAIVLTIVFALFHDVILDSADQLITQIKESRTDSTRVRAALNDMAFSRWQTEAYWFGHGVVENGSHFVEFMPIGSHHNWYGLLFVKGLVGLLSFALPFLITGWVLFIGSNLSITAKIAFGHFLVLSCFSLSENIEALAYLTWPAWLMIGIAVRKLSLSNPTQLR